MSENTENKTSDQKDKSTSRASSGKNETLMPEVNFSTFVMSLASSALVQLGEIPNPENSTVEEDLLLARHSIDILSMLQEKTKEGLSPDESRLLQGILYDLRVKYVMKSK